jgi:hypothetical protein
MKSAPVEGSVCVRCFQTGFVTVFIVSFFSSSAGPSLWQLIEMSAGGRYDA